MTGVALEFGLLNAEVGEAFTAWLQQQPGFGAELADVLLFLVGLAEMTGIDLNAEVERKLAINARREYVRDERGVLQRVASPAHLPAAGGPTPQPGPQH